MAHYSKCLIRNMMSATLIVSTIGLANANADVDPAICGLGGAAVGGVIGNQFGGGNGKKALTVIGAALGAAVGHSYCKQADSQDANYARENERAVLIRNSPEPVPWSNPRYGHGQNAQSHIANRGYYGDRECMMTRSVMQSSDGGRYVNDTYWCQDRGNWTQVTETTTISQITWGQRGTVQSTTTQTTTTYSGGGQPMRPTPQMPQQGVAPWIVSENQIARFQSDFKYDWAYPERPAKHIATELNRGRQFLTLDQLGRLLKGLKFDSERNIVLRTLAVFVDQQFGSMSSVIHAYTFENEGYQARRLLDDVQRQKERDSRPDVSERRDDRRDSRNDSRRGSTNRR